MKLETPGSLNHSYRFIDFVASLSGRNVPAKTLAQAQACFVDTIGVGLFGSIQPWSRMMAENTISESAAGRCTLLGRNERIAPAPTGLVNGTAIHGFELDDLISEASAHPGAVAVPAALAAAEHAGSSGQRLLLGIVAGYETLARVSIALGEAPIYRGFHMTGVAGPIAATVAAGVTLNLPTDVLLGAVGLACSTSSGIKNFAHSDGGVVKRMHAGRSVETGLRMCQLAARGFLGPRDALDGKRGLLEVFGGDTARPDQLTEDLGMRWAMDDVWVKVYPVCGMIQSPIQLMLQLRGPQPLAASNIEKIRIGVCRYGSVNNANPAPEDTMGAQFSIPYCVALASVGDPTDPASYGEKAIARKDLQDLARRVEIFVDPQADAAFPKRLAARAELQLTNGEVREAVALHAHGSPADPCTDAEREVKFRKLAGVAQSPPAVDKLIALMSKIGEMDTLGPLSEALRA